MNLQNTVDAAQATRRLFNRISEMIILNYLVCYSDSVKPEQSLMIADAEIIIKSSKCLRVR